MQLRSIDKTASQTPKVFKQKPDSDLGCYVHEKIAEEEAAMIQNKTAERTLFLIGILLCFMIPVTATAQSGDKEQERLKGSGNVMKELLDVSSGVPISVINKSECIIVFPSVKKAVFLVAGSYGRGVMTCRGGENFDGPWSTPAMMQSSGGGFALQAGGGATDFVILVMDDKGAHAIMKGKAKLGAAATVAAGPVDRGAESSTNATMDAEMLCYSRAQGVFTGVSLSGTSLGPDNEADLSLYGKKVSVVQIIAGSTVQTPDSAKELLAVLTEKSPGNVSKGK
jgi:SH3 domain-containing YSC84-like protein 1